MIIVFEGTPGSGKSYDVACKTIDNLKLGRVIYTNLDGMELPECKEAIKSISGLNDYQLAQQLHFLTKDQCKDFWNHVEQGALVIIDEAHLFFNARKWKDDSNQGFADWASTHRHHGFDCYLITQRIEKLDSQARSCAEWTYVYRKVNMFGSLIQKRYIVHSYAGDDTSGECLSKSVKTYDSRIFRTYQSYVAKDIKEIGTQKHANILKHPVFYAIPVAIILTIFLIVRSATSDAGLVQKMLNRNTAATVTAPGLPPEPDPLKQLNGSPKGQPASGGFTSPPAASARSASSVMPPVPSMPPVPMPGGLYEPSPKRLIATIDGKKIYKCGGRLCTEN